MKSRWVPLPYITTADAFSSIASLWNFVQVKALDAYHTDGLDSLERAVAASGVHRQCGITCYF